jgi:DNA-binding GntR family transcriptional regulator
MNNRLALFASLHARQQDSWSHGARCRPFWCDRVTLPPPANAQRYESVTVSETSSAQAASAGEGPTATRVALELREQIISGALSPGTRLKDSQLASHHQVSRNTLRDALKQLESDGLVVSRRNAGSAVRVLTETDAHDIYKVRHTLEAAGIDASTAADRATVRGFRHYVASSRIAVAENRWSDLGTSSLRLHQAIVGLLGSPRVDAFFSNTLAQLRLVFAVMNDESVFQTQWVPRDEELVSLLIAGNRRQAQMELRQYLLDSEAQVIDAIRAAANSR